MAPDSHRRQIVFFLAAVLLPCSVLVVLGVRMMSQERELAEKRLADERRRVVEETRQNLLGRLERIKIVEASAFAASQEKVTLPGRENSVVLVAPLEEGRLALPWEMNASGEDARHFLGSPEFSDQIRRGEAEEFGSKKYGAAAENYQAALAGAHYPVQKAYARLLLARVLMKSGERQRAEKLYRTILALNSSVTDDQRVPLALYAAAGLLDAEVGHEAVLKRVRNQAETLTDCPPAVVYLLRDLLQRLADSASAEIAGEAKAELQAVNAHVQYVEQTLALQRDFPGLGLVKALSGTPGNSDPIWVPYGEERWLVSVSPPVGRSPALLVAVRARDIFSAVEEAASRRNDGVGGFQIVTASEASGEPLGPNFPSMKAAFSTGASERLAGQWSLQRSFYLFTLVLVLSVTLFAAYLLWRDVRREVRLAEMRSQFVSSVTHELKTPLTAIRMFAETLGMGRGTDAPTQSEYLETIVNETERLTRLLNNVLDFSKIEQGKKTYRPEPISLAEVVQAAARAMQYPLSQQGFELRVEMENGLPAVRADADAIEQAILNLLANAMKYSGENREIELKLRRKDSQAVIQVTDRGVGIPAAEQARIFEKFYRVPSAHNRRVPGTGLGLTLVQHIARAHGGSVEVESQPGKGSTFSIHLPMEGAA
jgi:signal transduction histidine kinase/tetratricopeptide (TPR) repeat protein